MLMHKNVVFTVDELEAKQYEFKEFWYRVTDRKNRCTYKRRVFCRTKFDFVKLLGALQDMNWLYRPA